MAEGKEEVFDVVDEENRVVGRASRKEVHRNPELIHRVAHVLVFDTSGELFLQKRSRRKDIQPGKWDTSVGGHVDLGESVEAAALREMREELGIREAPIEFLYSYLHRSEVESEFVSTYRCTWNGPIEIQPEEIEEGRFWSWEEIRRSDPQLFTGNFLDEMERFKTLSEGNFAPF